MTRNANCSIHSFRSNVSPSSRSESKSDGQRSLHSFGQIWSKTLFIFEQMNWLKKIIIEHRFLVGITLYDEIKVQLFVRRERERRWGQDEREWRQEFWWKRVSLSNRSIVALLCLNLHQRCLTSIENRFHGKEKKHQRGGAIHIVTEQSGDLIFIETKREEKILFLCNTRFSCARRKFFLSTRWKFCREDLFKGSNSISERSKKRKKESIIFKE